MERVGFALGMGGMIFSERLKLARNRREVAKKELAAHLGIGERAYQNYEMGTREPSLEKLSEIAAYLDVSADYLLGRSNCFSKREDAELSPQEITIPPEVMAWAGTRDGAACLFERMMQDGIAEKWLKSADGFMAASRAYFESREKAQPRE